MWVCSQGAAFIFINNSIIIIKNENNQGRFQNDWQFFCQQSGFSEPWNRKRVSAINFQNKNSLAIIHELDWHRRQIQLLVYWSEKHGHVAITSYSAAISHSTTPTLNLFETTFLFLFCWPTKPALEESIEKNWGRWP